MNGSSTKIDNGSSFIRGEPSIIGSVVDIVENFECRLNDALEEIEREITQDIRSHGVGYPDWVPYLPLVDAQIIESQLVIGHNGGDDTAVALNDLEYGSPRSAPQALLRMSLVEAKESFRRVLDDKVERKVVPYA